MMDLTDLRYNLDLGCYVGVKLAKVHVCTAAEYPIHSEAKIFETDALFQQSSIQKLAIFNFYFQTHF